MHKPLFSRMGRISKKLPCRGSLSSSLSSKMHSSGTSPTHPYPQQSQTRTRANLNPTTVNTDESRRTDNSAAGELQLSCAGTSDDAISSCRNYMDDNWSPFDAPAVQQCLRTQSQPLTSLLEGREITPMYVSSQQNVFSLDTPVQRNPTLFYRTYAGYTHAQENITLSIVDSETGEYLTQFPTR